jgi:hypothetical protein
VLAGLFGLVLWFLLDLQVEKKVNLAEIATLIATIFISILFFRRAEREKYSDQLRKDVLLQRCDSTLVDLAELETLLAQPTPRYLDLVRVSTRALRSLGDLCTLCTDLSISVTNGTRANAQMHLRNSRRLLTDSVAAITPTQYGVVVANGIATIGSETQSEAKFELDSARRHLRQIQTQIVLNV